MKNELFKPEVEELFNQLEKISPKNITVCKQSCRDDYATCINAGKDAEDCKSTFVACIDECLKAGLNGSELKKAQEMLSKLKSLL